MAVLDARVHDDDEVGRGVPDETAGAGRFCRRGSLGLLGLRFGAGGGEGDDGDKREGEPPHAVEGVHGSRPFSNCRSVPDVGYVDGKERTGI